MRPTCTECALKHLSQASILLSEAHQGYPTHLFYSLGHMAEASDELVKEYPKYAEMIRAERKKLEENPEYSPDFDTLLNTVAEECEICQLEPGPQLSIVPMGLSSPSVGRGARNNPIAWTKCEVKYPTVQRKILSCATQLEGVPGIRSPIAVCRASIRCPP